MNWAPPAPFSRATAPPPSPDKCSTWIAGTRSWACNGDAMPALKAVKRLVRFAAWIGLAQGGALAQTSYEAESAVLSGGARVIARDQASNVRVVAGIGGEKDGRVTFNGVNAPRKGLYSLEIHFMANDERSLLMTVN